MLTIIIPTWQAEVPLQRLLGQLVGERVIVADGGSSDGTVNVALKAEAILAVGASGRGAQLRAGGHLAAMTSGDDDWFLFLHADSQLPEGWRKVVETAKGQGHPRYFRFRASQTGFKARLMDRMVALRCWALGLPYGDQGLLISKSDYAAVGGYAAMPLFEDVDMVRRVKRQGRLKPLPIALKTDVSAHWRDGLWKRGTRNIGLLWRYYRGETPENLLKAYRAL